eukprot:1139082-Lingulodinium_polyedra.AAC.1
MVWHSGRLAKVVPFALQQQAGGCEALPGHFCRGNAGASRHVGRRVQAGPLPPAFGQVVSSQVESPRGPRRHAPPIWGMAPEDLKEAREWGEQ